MSRAPMHFPAGQAAPDQHEPKNLESLESLEELSDDAIIAQQRSAHAPQRRASVTAEGRSVVIAEGKRSRAERTEKTVIIRDRRALDEMRRRIVERQGKVKRGRRSLWTWVAVSVLAFVTGAVAALVATLGAGSKTESGPGLPGSSSTSSALSAPTEPPLLDIEQLPLESGKKK